MTMLEALTLARDQGVRVRPVCWRRGRPVGALPAGRYPAGCWIECRWTGPFPRYVEVRPGEHRPVALPPALVWADEFLGEWEVAS